MSQDQGPTPEAKQQLTRELQDLVQVGELMYGDAAIRRAVFDVIVEYEAYLRSNCPPDHPALRFLDDCRQADRSDVWKSD